MTDKQPVFTFHRVREKGEQGDAGAWRAFLDFYSPLCLHLLSMYLPEGQDAAPRVVEKMLAALTANQYERFRATPSQTEREFLADIRSLLLDTAVPPEPDARTINQAARDDRLFTSEKLRALLDGLPLTHQEMVFLKLAGYTDASMELMTRIKPHVAQKAFERLEADYTAARKAENDRCLWPAEWVGSLRDMRVAKTEQCPPLHQFLRIHDGQVSWYDKEPVEKHVSGCLHCLERWTALREVGYWRRCAPAVPETQIEHFMRTVPVAAPPKASLFRRVFGVTG